MLRRTAFILLIFNALNCNIGYCGLSFNEKIDLLYAVDSRKDPSEIKADLGEFIVTLKAYDGLSPEKRIKKIFSETKRRYLHTYSLSSFFTDISPYGTYNCVTGTALFAVIFDELGIDYAIVEVPRHVYMVAFPKTERIAVESTNLKEGLYNWTEYNMNAALNFLLQTEQITDYDLRIKEPAAIIEEYFYSNHEHDFSGLAGMHFINRAIYLYDLGKSDAALEQLNLAEGLYEGPAATFIKGAILYSLIDKTSNQDIKLIHYLTLLYSIVEHQGQRDRIKGLFEFSVYEALVSRKDVAYADSAEALVIQNVAEADQKILIATIDEKRCVWNYNLGKRDEALENAQRGYSYDPDNKHFEDLLASLIVNQFYEDALEYGYSNQEAEKTLIVYQEQYGFLANQPLFINFYVAFYADLGSDYFFKNKPAEGFVCLEKLLSYKDHADLKKSTIDHALSDIYGEISTYYFRKEDYPESMIWIDKAIIYEPDSYLHKHRREYIESKL